MRSVFTSRGSIGTQPPASSPGTIDAALIRSRFRPAGFDYLRILLAFLVLLFHIPGSCYGATAAQALWTGPFRSVFGLILPAFFALSGFLVTGSLQRSQTIFNFFGLRALRIVPALTVEVLISAFILGPLVTSLPLGAYFASRQLHAYVLNIVGDIHYVLPGVFLNNPSPGIINGQLWTIPFELKCYLVLGVLALFRLHRKRVLFLIAVILIQAGYLVQSLMHPAPYGITGHVLISCFLSGVTMFLFRDRIVLNGWAALACALFCIGSAFTPLRASALAFPAAYFTVWLGVLNPRKSRILSSGDYSYGIYLFGFPVEQTVAWLGGFAHHWLISLCISVPVTICLAVASYHLIEKHALTLRRFLPVIESRLQRRRNIQAAAG